MEPKYAKLGKKKFILKKEHNKFKFECTKCGECCHGSNILLSPYDILRLCFALNMKTSEFHKKFTRYAISKTDPIPKCMLKTNPVCLFFKEGKGCQIYDHRPYMCRAFPVGNIKEQYFILDSYCKGCGKGEKKSIKDWISSADVASYKTFDDLWIEFLDKVKKKGPANTKESQVMFIKLLYDFDNPRVDTMIKNAKLKAEGPTDKFISLLGLAEKLIL